MKENWQKIDKPFSEYPIGTKARISWERGGWWTKTEKGWMLRILTSCSLVDNELQLNQNQSIVLQCCSNRRYSPLTRKEWRVNRLREC